MPIVDGFNSPLKIQQDWLPDLLINYGGMRSVARFDHCRTCHLGIDRTEKGGVAAFPPEQYPQPFTTHPRTDVYVTSASPHPGPKFGCTICHEGQGSGTGFSTASHTPNDPAQAISWEHAHNYQSNHFWEFPMLPDRFTESTCIKCHHNVVELGVNPQFGATAPKVVEGYNIVRQFGCFGCHEVNGFDGAKQIGPDLRLEPSTKEEMAKLAADPSANPGTMRKVGPALLHIGQKTTPAWTEYWTEVPQRFRPTTRMPSFFKQLDEHGQPVLNSKGELRQLEGQGDKEAEQLTPVEIASLTHYLFSKSTPIDLLKPDDDYKADAERGKKLFSQRGCLACHSHKDFPTAHADFGPDLSKVHDKLKPGEEGRNWLYSWIRDPERYHPRTKMPNLFLEKYKEGDNSIDPAADIAAFLLEGGPGEYKEMKFDPAGLEFLAKLYLSKALTKAQVEEVFRDKRYPERNKANIKGDEIELYTEGDKRIDERMMLNYVGRRTISRYGCYGCHDISGFEKARPIGTALQNWGRKDSSKLAMEHIHEFLHHHGQPDGSSTAEAAESGLKKALAHSYATPQEEAQGLSLAYFYEQVLHNNRVGFLWQKLRSPRSYDYKKIETKNYDERLRMPKFPFTPQQIEAVETFVLGLVAEPPAEQYVYRPKGAAHDRVQGEKLLTKYNCTGCHMVDMPQVNFAVDPEGIQPSALTEGEYPEALPLLMKLKPPRKAETGHTHVVDGKELPVIAFRALLNSSPDPQDPIEDQEYGFNLWETLQVGEKVLYPSSLVLVPAKQLVGVDPSRGGDFAEWLVTAQLKADKDLQRNMALQAAPPPLYREGTKVQTPWLYHFLKNPYQLRHTTLLRMPQFNMSDAEAMQLANYFSAVDGSEYPYQDVPERQPEYLSVKEHEDPGYLAESWKLLNAPLCIKCHSLGGRQYQAVDPKSDIRGPNLESVPDRLRPDWTLLWLSKPQWITPYTSMPQPIARNGSPVPEFFHGDSLKQTTALRDALMNYHRLMEQQGKYIPPEPAKEKPAAGAKEENK
jgi:cytochrome c551/c552